MTHTVVALLVTLGFVVGLLTGYVLGREVHLEHPRRAEGYRPPDRGRVGVMRSILGWFSRLLGRPGVATTLLVIALLLSAASGFLNVRTAGDVHNVVTCTTDYNRADGEARDDRGSAQRKSTRSELRLWLRFRDQFSDKATTLPDVLDTIDQRIKRLRVVLNTQTANPYPRPDSCDDGRFDDADLDPPEATK